MDDLILNADEPVGDMGSNGAFDFFNPDGGKPPVVMKEDADDYNSWQSDKIIDDAYIPPTREKKEDVVMIVNPEPQAIAEPYPYWLIGGALAVAAYILLGD